MLWRVVSSSRASVEPSTHTHTLSRAHYLPARLATTVECRPENSEETSRSHDLPRRLVCSNTKGFAHACIIYAIKANSRDTIVCHNVTCSSGAMHNIPFPKLLLRKRLWFTVATLLLVSAYYLYSRLREVRCQT